MPISATGYTSKVTRLFADKDAPGDLRDDIRRAARTWVSNGTDAWQRASDLTADARDLADYAFDQTAHVSQKLKNEIRANPLRSSAIALACGLVLGALLARR